MKIVEYIGLDHELGELCGLCIEMEMTYIGTLGPMCVLGYIGLELGEWCGLCIEMDMTHIGMLGTMDFLSYPLIAPPRPPPPLEKKKERRRIREYVV